ADPITFQSVKLAFAKVTKLDSGHVDIAWNTEDVRDVQLATEPFAHGMSKMVYKMRIGTEPFVAKRCAKIPETGLPPNLRSAHLAVKATPLPMEENTSYLTAELRIQHSGVYFLDEFYAAARKAQERVST
ncbi:hypothetical protein MPER_01630, partial [Moniliophthora perniciosa FA553]